MAFRKGGRAHLQAYGVAAFARRSPYQGPCSNFNWNFRRNSKRYDLPNGRLSGNAALIASTRRL
jgi:hypothetical protein